MYPKIIGLVGPIRAGKTTVAHYLASRYGYTLASNSEVLRDICANLGLPATRENLGKLGDAIFKSLGNDAIARFRLGRTACFPIVVDGIRYREELQTYSLEPSFRLIAVTASDDVRYERAAALSHEIKDSQISRSQFASLLDNRSEQHVPELVSRANVVILNNLDPNDLRQAVDQAIKKLSDSSAGN